MVEIEPTMWDGRPALEIGEAMLFMEGTEYSVCVDFLRCACKYGVDVAVCGNTVFLVARTSEVGRDSNAGAVGV